VGLLLWIVGSIAATVLSVLVLVQREAPSFSRDAVLCLFCPNGALVPAMKFLVHLEYGGEAQWKNVGRTHGTEKKTLGLAMGFMILSSLMNAVPVAWLECVIPTKFGVSGCMVRKVIIDYLSGNARGFS